MSVERAIDISQPPATSAEITPSVVNTLGESPLLYSPRLGADLYKHVFDRTPASMVRLAQTYLDNRAVRPLRLSRGRRGSGRGLSRLHSGGGKCGMCEGCRMSQGAFIVYQCTGRLSAAALTSNISFNPPKYLN